MTCPSLTSRRAFLTASLALLATPAFASSAKKEKKGGKEGEGEEAADPVIKLQPMALPIIANGKLVNYVFVQMDITLKPGEVVTVFDGKEPQLRDAIVREAHSKPFLRPDSYVALDEGRLKASVLRQANGLMGPGKVALVSVIKQTPRNFVAPPPKPGARAKAAPRRAPEGDPNLVP